MLATHIVDEKLKTTTTLVSLKCMLIVEEPTITCTLGIENTVRYLGK